METKINVKKRECNREKKIKMKKITKKKKYALGNKKCWEGLAPGS